MDKTADVHLYCFLIQRDELLFPPHIIIIIIVIIIIIIIIVIIIINTIQATTQLPRDEKIRERPNEGIKL
ncbi:hypothetical protein E2C01_009749 [Portunus trituberculatus]|uniref:Uncharacterized protein n=1 Tax=Portunus trituberculatus TaxID=210409 RepID=A0A5B7D6K4_PORTR|nr:hypothetical protein [Portunus trituberculatus]